MLNKPQGALDSTPPRPRRKVKRHHQDAFQWESLKACIQWSKECSVLARHGSLWMTRPAMIHYAAPRSHMLAMADELPDPQKTLMRIDIEESTHFERANPTLLALAASLDLTSQQLDELFLAAAAI